jgi:exosortase N
MGLKMVLLSLFITLIFLSYQQQQKNTHTHAFIIILFLMISYLLTIISNLTRIILITIFESHPETLSHEFIGILCFITYTVIPLWFLVKLIPIHSIKKKSQIGTTFNYTIFKSLIMVLLSLFTLYRFTDIGSKEKIQPEFVSLHYFSEDFSSSLEDHNVIKLTNEDYLIYVKQAPNFYAADHSPIICWKGSGYEVTKEQIITTANAKVYFSELKKNQDVLYSTWWYDSGNDKTILQHKWRFNNLVNGDRYHLINVVSNNKNDLLKKTNTLLSDNIFGE